MSLFHMLFFLFANMVEISTFTCARGRNKTHLLTYVVFTVRFCKWLPLSSSNSSEVLKSPLLDVICCYSTLNTSSRRSWINTRRVEKDGEICISIHSRHMFCGLCLHFTAQIYKDTVRKEKKIEKASCIHKQSPPAMCALVKPLALLLVSVFFFKPVRGVKEERMNRGEKRNV